MLQLTGIHHVSLPVTDLQRSKRFYSDVLGLRELPRPAFPFAGAWYEVSVTQQLHLIVGEHSTFRRGEVDSHDVHFAIRVGNYQQTVDYLRSRGYRPDADDPLYRSKENPTGTAGFPQVYILDPDRNVIELNAASL